MDKQLNCCLLIFELMGLQYFRLSDGNFEDRPTFPRAFFLAFLLAAVSLLVALLSLAAASSENAVAASNNDLMSAFQSCLAIALVLVIYTSLIQSFASTRSLKKFYSLTAEIEELGTQQFNTSIDFKKFKKANLVRLAVFLIFAVAAYIIMAVLQTENLRLAILMTIFLVPILFILLIAFKFVFYVALVNYQLEFLFKLIEITFKLPTAKITDLSSLMSVRRVEIPENLIKKLITARRIYQKICKNGDLVNASNGITILILILSIVMSMTVAGYEIYVLTVGEKTFRKASGKSN